MSELINGNAGSRNIHLRLLAGVSMGALLVAATASASASDDAGHPVVWVELGGQLEAMSRAQNTFTAPFLLATQPLEPFPFGARPVSGGTLVTAPTPSPFEPVSPLSAQKPPANSFGGEAKISFEPAGTDWVFSAGVRYGRSNGDKTIKKTVLLSPYVPRSKYVGIRPVKFSNAVSSYNESHAVLDFQAGRDVGLGVFGRNSDSVLNFGVRFAQFISRSDVRVDADPNVQIYVHHPAAGKYGYSFRFHNYDFSAHSQRNFHGVGPSLSWNGSADIISSPGAAEFTLDWGLNGAVLFGRQKTRTDHGTNAYDGYKFRTSQTKFHTQYKHATSSDRTHSVVVPNVGGFAGLSLKFPNAKISLGYRADFFFGVMDAGIDVRHTEDVSFHGPFATISIGLGG